MLIINSYIVKYILTYEPTEVRYSFPQIIVSENTKPREIFDAICECCIADVSGEDIVKAKVYELNFQMITFVNGTTFEPEEYTEKQKTINNLTAV